MTPVSTGRSRDQAHTAPAVRATASRSQLISPVSSRVGEAASIAASQGRRRWVPATNHVVSRASAAKTSALTTMNHRISWLTSGSTKSWSVASA